MKNYLKFAFILMLFSKMAFSQRKSISIVVINDGKYPTEIVKSVVDEYVSKHTTLNTYDINPIPYNLKTYSSGPMQSYEVKSLLESNKIGNNVLAYWWNRQNDGSFNSEILGKRGKSNATDNDVMISSNSARGLNAIEEKGENLIQYSYIVAVKINGEQNQEEIYDRQDELANKGKKILTTGLKLYNSLSKDPERKNAKVDENEIKVDRLEQGYKVKYSFFLFKINYDDINRQKFYDYYLDKSEKSQNVRNKKIVDFNGHNFPLNFMKEYTESRAALCKKVPGEKDKYYDLDELYQMVYQRVGYSATNFSLDRKEEEDNRLVLISTSPINAKVGTKEGIYGNDLLYVYQNVQQRNGKIEKKYVGAIRANEKSVWYNTGMDADGNSKGTNFYKVHGIRSLEKGMSFEKRHNRGTTIFANFDQGFYGGQFVSFSVEDITKKNARWRYNYSYGYDKINNGFESQSLTNVMGVSEINVQYKLNYYLPLNLQFGMYSGLGIPIVSSDEGSYLTLNVPTGIDLSYYFTPKVGVSLGFNKNLLNLPAFTYSEETKWQTLNDNRGNIVKWSDISQSFTALRFQLGLIFSF